MVRFWARLNRSKGRLRISNLEWSRKRVFWATAPAYITTSGLMSVFVAGSTTVFGCALGWISVLSAA